MTTAAVDKILPPGEFQYLATAAVFPSKTNPRKTFNPVFMKELTDSISVKGVLTPILVRPVAKGHEIVFGEQRWRAAQAAGLHQIPARVKELDDVEVLEFQVIENAQRRDLHPLEEAAGFRALLKTPGYDVEKIAGKIGLSTKYVYDSAKLLDLTKEAQQLFRDDLITKGHAILLARLTPDDQERAIEEGLFETEQLVLTPEQEDLVPRGTGAPEKAAERGNFEHGAGHRAPLVARAPERRRQKPPCALHAAGASAPARAPEGSVMEYAAFLAAKVVAVPRRGFEISEADVNPACKPHVRAIVPWMVRLGRAACFSRFGLQKTVTQLEAVRLTRERSGGRGLIVCPLGVRQEFRRDAVERLGWSEPPRFIRTTAEAEDPAGIFITNYESVREGKVDPNAFDVASLDEAAVLRGFGGTKTFRQFMALFAGDDRSGVRTRGVPFRYVATATPSPNEYIELLAYAAYLDVLDVSAAKTRFFKRDSTKADHLTLHEHKAEEFWIWVASWAMFLQRPSDLGPEYSDEGYVLPPIDVRWHEVPTDHATAGSEKDGQGRMFKDAAMGVTQAAREKRESLGTRVAALMEIIRDGDSEPAVLRIEPGPGEEEGLSEGIREDTQAQSREAGGGKSASARALCVGSGVSGQGEGSSQEVGQAESGEEESVSAPDGLRSDDGGVRGDVGTPGRRLRDLRGHAHKDPGDGQAGAVLTRGPRPRNRRRARNPLLQLQQRAGSLQGQPGAPDEGDRVSTQWIVWCDLNNEQDAIERAFDADGISYSSVYGSLTLDERERRLEAWRDRRTAVLIGKAVMLGSGLNLQQCHRAIYVGIGFKFAEWAQSIHRIQRYGQSRTVRVYLIYTEAEREVRRTLERKWQQHEQLVDKMAGIIREYGLASAALSSALGRSMGVERVEASGPGYLLVNNDAVLETRSMAAESVGLVVTSIPFANQYEYSPSFHDFGHTDDFAHFWRQMDFLTPELLRVLQPGRGAAVHVKDRITPGGINGLGFQTVHPLSDECVAHFTKHGFAFLGRKTVVTDVVRENAQTYRLGWTEQCKDGSRMGAGLPEYVLLFRKPQTDGTRGFADVPVVKQKKSFESYVAHVTECPGDQCEYPRVEKGWRNEDGYSRARWQFDAHGFTRSNGDRPLSIEDLKGLTHPQVFKLFRKYSLTHVYDFERDVAIAEYLDSKGMLPPTFMLLQPQSWHPDVWTDITRMRTLNMLQERKGLQQHMCPMPFDIPKRLITQFSMRGEVVYDPFMGLGTVPLMAMQLGRKGIGVDLCPRSFADACAHLKGEEQRLATPTLFDLLDSMEPDALEEA